VGEVRDVSADALRRALDVEHVRNRQLPPEHSALKVAGQRAYALARAGQQFSLAERDVDVETLELHSAGAGLVRVRLRVSKGYYVRSFARDLCKTLGVPGHLSALRRTESGGFEVGEASPWPPERRIVPLSVAAAARRALPEATLSEQGVVRTRHGKTLNAEHFERPPPDQGVSAWFDPHGELVALGIKELDLFRVRRGFAPR
jgi:tRNA pseudouridine55 synthase